MSCFIAKHKRKKCYIMCISLVNTHTVTWTRATLSASKKPIYVRSNQFHNPDTGWFMYSPKISIVIITFEPICIVGWFSKRIIIEWYETTFKLRLNTYVLKFWDLIEIFRKGIKFAMRFSRLHCPVRDFTQRKFLGEIQWIAPIPIIS